MPGEVFEYSVFVKKKKKNHKAMMLYITDYFSFDPHSFSYFVTPFPFSLS